MTEEQQQRWANLAIVALQDGGTQGLLASGQIEMARALVELMEEVRVLEHRLGQQPPDGPLYQWGAPSP